ncbi:MAG: ABC transporter permease subunit [Syntrophothermus sp.]
MTKKTATSLLTVLITVFSLLTGCSNSNETKENGSIKLRRHEDIGNKRVGVLLGSVHDKYMMNTYPQAAIMQYKSPSEIILAVKSGKVDAAIYTTETLTGILKEDPELKALGDTIFTIPIAMGFNQNNDALRGKFNEFLQKIKSNGTFDDMVGRWLKRGIIETPEIRNPDPKGELVVGVVSDKGLPFTIVKDNKMVGFDIELSERFAAFLGKKLKLADMEFGSLIIAAATNKIDMIASTLMITEERKKQIDFSDPYYRLGATIFSLAKNIDESDASILTKLDDIRHKRIGILAGTVYDAFVTENYPEAIGLQYNNNADMILALKTGKIDVAFFDYFSGRVMMKSNPEIGILTDDALNLPQGYGFSKKNPELRKKFNNYLKKIKANGYFDQIYKRWFIDDPEKAVMPEFKFDANGPVLTLGISVGDLPYSTFINGNYIGFDNELLKSFAQSAGYQLKIISMDFSGLIASLASGKTDIIADGICITAERSKQVDFSDKYLDFRTSVLALNSSLGKAPAAEKKEASAMPSFIDGVMESFRNNIILEDRYLLIVDGLKTTAVISVFSILFGSLLGALICFMRMSHRKILQIPARIYISLLRGTPVLVVLMIIFYVIFASVDIDPAIVAVIAFGLNFAAYVSEMFRTGIEGVDRGQTEAGIAMGFSKVKTFIYIVMPQAAIRVLPVYKGEIISLVKMTSIVGYIAVQDLTKASDIIRSRTFDAFFPLIMVAILYFFISWLLMLLLGYVERRTDPRTKRQMEAVK